MSTYSHQFTIVHARKLAAKVATDLKRIQRYYGKPSQSDIDAYQGEITELLKGGYLKSVTYGFKRNDKWIKPTVEYTADELAGMYADDDDPGRIPTGGQVDGAPFTSFLIYSKSWWALTSKQREDFEKTLPVKRSTGTAPGYDGYLQRDKTYSAGGKSLGRSTLQ